MKNLYGVNIFNMLSLGVAYEMQEEFDIIHDHNGHFSLPTANISTTPVVITLHGPLTPEMRRICQNLRRPWLVSITDAQRKLAPDLNYAGTVHNGLPMKDYPFSAGHDGYLLFVGRISMEKGVHFAIQVAQEMDLPLIIAAKLEDADKPYFQEYIEPFLSKQVRWIGEVDEAERNKLMSRAMCFLHPITWEEPFGLTLIESMACGCPVVAFGRGSIPEIIQNRKTGFVVHDIVEMIAAVKNIGKIDRMRCRRYSLRNFSAGRMADNYEEIYRKIVQERTHGHTQFVGHRVSHDPGT